MPVEELKHVETPGSVSKSQPSGTTWFVMFFFSLSLLSMVFDLGTPVLSSHRQLFVTPQPAKLPLPGKTPSGSPAWTPKPRQRSKKPSRRPAGKRPGRFASGASKKL